MNYLYGTICFKSKLDEEVFETDTKSLKITNVTNINGQVTANVEMEFEVYIDVSKNNGSNMYFDSYECQWYPIDNKKEALISYDQRAFAKELLAELREHDSTIESIRIQLTKAYTTFDSYPMDEKIVYALNTNEKELAF